MIDDLSFYWEKHIFLNFILHNNDNSNTILMFHMGGVELRGKVCKNEFILS